ncbi:aminotransferase [Enterococcus sp. DIV2402]|uniref:Aminotransferase n=1 Tax=Candidatus Enterococcus lowellii TaxID=2230877 RepID=A0ABZ2SK01_9ENTE|nr:pyridoxal phosphate-dependent aminotransferase [Enterococcus sp. DIV2402]MBO0465855.1 pyridoxal phosphate-dependent aminotransferase [Enterococcus sp. DIV2402]
MIQKSKILQELPPQFFAHLVQQVNQKIAEGQDVINLGQGNPDQPTPSGIIETLQQAVENPLNHKYSQFRGNQFFKQAAADFYLEHYGVTLDPETEIAVMGGSKIGLVELPLALLNPGDRLLLPDPGYPDYLSGVVLAQIEKELLPLLPENGYLPDYETVDKEKLEQAKLLFLNYPNNPTGAQATSEFFDQTVSFAKEHEIAVVHDFAYGALGTNEEAPVSFLQSSGAKEVGVELYTLSKTYNMAGWRIAFAAGNAEIIEAINIIQDHLFVGLFPALQEAGAYALKSNEKVDELVALYNRRRKAFVEAAAQIGWQAYPSTGAFYAWMPVPKGYTSRSFAEFLLNEVAVAVAPGNGFGDGGEGYVRVGLLVEEERLQEAIARIATLNLTF